MILITFRYANGDIVSFHLDFLLSMDNKQGTLNIVLTNGTKITFPIDHDDFIAQVYSDTPDYKEYREISFEEPEGTQPEVVAF